MRSAALLLSGMVLIGVGIGLIVGAVPGRWVIAPVLVVAGLGLKVAGLLAGGPEGPVGSDTRVTTLGGARVERPRAGIPAGRAPLRTSHRRAGAVPASGVAPRPVASPLSRRRAS